MYHFREAQNKNVFTYCWKCLFSLFASLMISSCSSVSCGLLCPYAIRQNNNTCKIITLFKKKTLLILKKRIIYLEKHHNTINSYINTMRSHTCRWSENQKRYDH